MVQNQTPRKACDVCYGKRIRCDAKKPRCSHCVLYDSECTFQAISRKARSRKQRPNEDVDNLQAQVQSLEASLHQAQQRIVELEGRVPDKEIHEDPGTLNSISSFGSHHFTLAEIHPRQVDLELPYRSKVLSAVEKYLSKLNSILPLFEPEKLLRCVNLWYERPDQRENSTWAAINVVLALAHRQTSPEEGSSSGNATEFLNNAQSVLDQALVGESKLIHVQTLIGMVLLLQATYDWKPAATLIAIAIRLSHELGLHRQAALDQLDSSEVVERSRVFWIAYVLDRDIAMRLRLPPIQNMNDISIDWPSAAPEDDAGVVSVSDGTSSFNFFRSRIHLACIQGEVYETMHASTAASNSQSRLQSVTKVHSMLDDWYTRIPLPFRRNAIAQAGDGNLRRAFGVLYSTHLTCRILVCQVHAMESQWLKIARDFGRMVVQVGFISSPPLPTGWQQLIHECRQYVDLFGKIESKDPAFIWMTACTYISGSVCLTANNIFNPWHSKQEMDITLTELAFTFLEDMIQQTSSEPLKYIRSSWVEMLQQARVVSSQIAGQGSGGVPTLKF